MTNPHREGSSRTPQDSQGRIYIRQVIASSKHMNILQSIAPKHDLLVSLNSDHDINPKAILKSMIYTHPKFNLNTYLNQKKQHLICKNGFAFSGAYWGNGFHEDGVVSALNAIKYSGINP